MLWCLSNTLYEGTLVTLVIHYCVYNVLQSNLGWQGEQYRTMYI